MVVSFLIFLILQPCHVEFYSIEGIRACEFSFILREINQ
jgi:hypothetical protein